VIYVAQRLDTGALVEFEDDPDLAPGYGEVIQLPLDGQVVACKRALVPPQVVATDRRLRYDDNHMAVRSDGRLTSMQLPTKAQCEASGLPLAPHYNAHGEASFMTRYSLSEYTKALNSKDPHGEYALDL
jgi:hypothetical protein